MKTRPMTALAAVLLAGVHVVLARPMVCLDGAWSFRLARDDTGESERWFDSRSPYTGSIGVPGCWDAQGIGDPTEKMRHHAVGVGWYQRAFEVPPAWWGKRVWLHVGGVHRSAKIWLNGRLVGECWGYPLAFRFDVTQLLTDRGEQVLVIAVDSRRHPERDPLTGCFDIIDFMDIDWGGIFESVRLECTDADWLDDVFVQPDPAVHAAAVNLRVCRSPGQAVALLTVDYTVQRWTQKHDESETLDHGTVGVPTDGSEARFQLRLRTAPLWAPSTPELLVLRVKLRRGGEIIDEQNVRFGLCRLEIRGSDFYLNGERFMFRGYGDDFNFPRDLVPPADVGYWRDYLRVRRDFGFNGVRHHSMMPTESYLQAADEVGIMVQPELPIAYRQFLDQATPAGYELYRKVWAGYIRQMRNHPSVFGWSMSNEEWDSFSLAPELYTLARELDPSRPVIDSDGLWRPTDRDTTDYLCLQFDEWKMPWGQSRDKYVLKSPTTRPIIVHEMANLSVLPDPAEIGKYDGAIEPFWITAMRKQVEARHLEGLLPQMLQASRGLQASLLKLNMEAARLSPEVDGYHQWLFRDYWCQSTGFVSQFDQPRGLSREAALQFNDDVALLWDRRRASFRCGEETDICVFLSDFRPASVAEIGPVRVLFGGDTFEMQPPAKVRGRGLLGPWTARLKMPVVATPKKEMLQVEAGPVHNEWPVWAFPIPAATSRQAPVVRCRWLSEETLEQLAAGERVLVTDERFVLPTMPARFKPAWWHGDENSDHTYGNMVLEHPAVRGFPHDGYGDLQMFTMMDDRPVVRMDQLPVPVEPIIWCLDVPWQMRPKAYLLEARVGKGRLLVSTLDLSGAACKADPAAVWMLNRLLEYVAGDEFTPKAGLPVDWLRERVRKMGMPVLRGAVGGFSRLVSSTEKPQPWYSYREDGAPICAVRQTDGRQEVRWQTAPVPRDVRSGTVMFVWAGGLGWQTEPGGGHFSLLIDGKPAIVFPFTSESATWSGAGGSPELRYVMRRVIGPDTFGLFILTVPATTLTPGKPVELAVTATSQNSRRWFGLNTQADVPSDEGKDEPE